MDHQAFAQLLGNYGEFVGALLVVATLAYLARQITQNSLKTGESLITVLLTIPGLRTIRLRSPCKP